MQRAHTVECRQAILREAMELMAADCGSELSLADVAARIATSRRQLQRCFAEVGATSFRARLTAIRMEQGAELLATTRLPVREVARRVGYRQAAQFAKTFRRHHGAAPSEYRAQRRPTLMWPPEGRLAA